jgi:prepilin signal peptidase PulO-like enzyme (type II secretory pathway)
MLTALAFVLVVDTFVVAGVRQGKVPVGLDWPVVVAHLLLIASLIAISAIDIEEYLVDLRITRLLVGVGCVAHVLWTPVASGNWWRPGAGTAATTMAAATGLILARLIWPDVPPPEEDEAPAQPASSPKQPENASGRTLPVWMMVAVLAGVIGLMAIDATTRPSDATTRSSSRSFPIRAGLILLTCFGGIVAGSAIHRESDEEIAEALEEERPLARRVAIAELLYLSPAIVLGVGSLLLLKIPAVGEGWLNVLAWSPVAGHVPVTGLATAVSGMIVAGGVGWGVRIFFTLILGKEAFGLGDVHIMAAAGAVAGWVVVVVGFFLGAVFALAGVLCLLAVKRSRAIPFGPWLSIGIVLAIVAYQPIYDWFAPGLKGLMFMLNAGEPG